MQIILASAKIMNDRSATKGDACQSKKLKSIPDISLSLPRFQKEAEGFARIVQPLFYVSKGSELKIQAVWAKTCRGAMTRFIIENRIDKPEDLCAFSYEGFTYEPKLGERLRVGERSSWTSQAAEPSAGMPDFPHFIKQ